MERHVQERLVGAAVLMAAAIILIPEMLSGPDRETREPATQRAVDEPAVKTYTIDLNRPPGTPASTNVPEEAAPPPEQPEQTATVQAAEKEAIPVPPETPQANPERVTETPPARASTSSAERAAAADVQARETPKSTAAQVSKPDERAERTLASEPAVPSTRGWAVQLGSFSSRASAERLAAEMRADRYDVFVMPVQTGRSTLYRVRIGPLRDRAAADETLRRIKSRVAGAAVVAHP